MHTAQRRAAVGTEKFAFRKTIHGSWRDHPTRASASTAAEYEDMSIDEIFNGSTSNFPGLLTFVEKFVLLQRPDEETRVKLFKYINFIRGKARGILFFNPSSTFYPSYRYLYDDCDLDKKLCALPSEISM